MDEELRFTRHKELYDFNCAGCGTVVQRHYKFGSRVKMYCRNCRLAKMRNYTKTKAKMKKPLPLSQERARL